MALSLTTAPTTEPLSLAQVKAALQIDHTVDDDRIEAFVLPPARMLAETIARRACCEQTWTLTLSHGFGRGGPIYLPRPPLSSVTSISYIDSDDATQTWAASKYTVTAPSGDYAGYGSIRPADGESYPSTRGLVDDVTIVYVAGYGATAASVPAGLRAAIELLCRYQFGDLDPKDQQAALATAMTVIGPWRAPNVALRMD